MQSAQHTMKSMFSALIRVFRKRRKSLEEMEEPEEVRSNRQAEIHDSHAVGLPDPVNHNINLVTSRTFGAYSNVAHSTIIPSQRPRNLPPLIIPPKMSTEVMQDIQHHPPMSRSASNPKPKGILKNAPTLNSGQAQ